MLVRVKLLSSSIVVITRLCQQKLIVLQVALNCEIACITTCKYADDKCMVYFMQLVKQ